MNRPIKLLVLVGPTAVGKTAVALDLARSLRGEVISADSMQVYRGLDIGTDKASAADRAEVPHHLIDVASPDEPFNVRDYQRLAQEAIARVDASGHLPILAGGTGLYVRAVVDDVLFPDQQPDPAIRQQLEALSRQVGADSLHRRLEAVDPEAAARIHPHNVRRVIRALEVYERTGVPITEHRRRAREHAADRPPKYDAVWVGLIRPRAELYERIDRRVDRQVERGLVQEARDLYARGLLPEGSTAGQALGYKEMLAHIEGRATLQAAMDDLRKRTRRYAKRQLSWFRANPRVTWFDLSTYADRAAGARAIERHVVEQFSARGA